MSDPQDMQVEETVAQEIPAVLPVLPLRDTVVFPDTMIPLTIGQERSIKLIDDVLAGDRLLAMVTSKDAEVETPGPDLLYPVGTVGLAHKMIKLPDGTMRILVQGLQRVRVKEYVREEPYLVARTEKIEDVSTESRESDALRASLLSVFSKIVELVPYLPDELEMAAANIEDPGPLAFFIASTMRLKTEDKQELLEEVDVQAPAPAHGIMKRELEVLELGSKIQNQVQSRDGQDPAGVLPAPAAQGHPGRAGRDRRDAGRGQRAARRRSRSRRSPRRSTRRPAGSSTGSQSSPQQRRVRRHPHVSRLDRVAALERAQRRTTWTWRTPARCSTRTTTTWRTSRTASSSSWPCRSSRPTCTAPSSASSVLPAWARPAWARASPGPWGASSSASAWAACATRPRSAAIAAPTWAPCPAPSSAPSATPAAATRCS